MTHDKKLTGLIGEAVAEMLADTAALIAMMLLRLACWFAWHANTNDLFEDVIRRDHIRKSARIAGWSVEAGDLLAARGVEPAEAARLFRDALGRVQ